MMTVKELDTKVRNGELKYHHTAKASGYVLRRTPSFDSTRYHDISYYVEQ